MSHQLLVSLHTGQTVDMADLVRNGAVVKKVSDTLYRIELPAKDGVGPIGGLWKSEPQRPAK